MCSRPRKPQRKPKPERGGGLRLVDQRGVVQPQLVQRVAQFRVVVAVDRVEPGEHHRPRVVVAGQRLGGGPRGAGHRVADPGLPDVLDPGDQVADLARAQALGRHRLRRDHADLERVVRRPGGHHQAPLAPGQLAVHHPDVGDHAPVGVVHRVEDQRPGRRVRVAGGRRDLRDHGVQQVGHALAGLGRDPEHVRRLAADDAGQFLGVLLRLGGGQVDLVQHRDQVQVGLERQVQVGQRLRLDPLGRVHQQDRALAGGQRPGHLVGEVDVPGGVDQVEHVLLAVRAGPRQPDRLALDGDAALPLDVHPVQVLRAHLPVAHHPGELQHPVGQRGLAVVDVRDDAEVPDHAQVGMTGAGRGLRAIREDLLGHCWHRNPPGSNRAWSSIVA